MPDVVMPRLSDSMEEGTIVAWQVADGTVVVPGQELAEVETDKATVSFEAEVEGTIKLLVPEGETVALGAVIATIAVDGEPAQSDSSSSNGSAAAAPPSEAAEPEEPAPAAVQATDSGAAAAERSGQAKRAVASPLARRIAVDLGVDLNQVVGSGPAGRIVRSDVERSAESVAPDGAPAPPAPSEAPAEAPADAEAPAAAEAPAPSAPVTAKGEAESIPLSSAQKVVARRMAESRATVPDFSVAVEVEMEAAWGLREELKRNPGPSGSVPSLNDFVVLACGRALREHPKANSAYVDGEVVRFSRVNVGVAIASEDSLIVATVFDADRQSLGEIGRTTRLLAEQVRDGTITPPSLAGATFTVSNLGMFGVDEFVAVVNAPQAAILAVGAVKPKVVPDGDDVAVRRCMTITLAADHRVLYGADAARLLARVRELLEQPLVLLAG